MSNGIRIAVDSGHGMNTAGKRTPPLPQDLYINGRLVRKKGERIHEKEFNKPTAEYLIAALNRCGFETCNVSPGTNDVALRARTDAANAFGAHCYVSKHYNALTMDYWRNNSYFVAFRWKNGKPESTRLGELISDEIVAINGLENCGCKTDVDFMKIELWVLKHSTAPVAILTESGFMDVWEDAKRMLDPAYQKADAEATCRGICKYYNVPYVPEKSVSTSKVTTKDVCYVRSVISPDNELNMRSKPDMTGTIIDIFNTGDFIVVTKEQSDGWVYAQGCKNGASRKGWVHKNYLKEVDLSTKEIGTTNTPDGTVNIRSYPTSKTNNVIAVMGVEDDFRIIDDMEGSPYSHILYIKDQLPILGYADSEYFFRHYVVKVVNTNILNVRSTPDSRSNTNIVNKLGAGNLVEVYNPIAGTDGAVWYRVGTGGKVLGYIHSAYVARV